MKPAFPWSTTQRHQQGLEVLVGVEVLLSVVEVKEELKIKEEGAVEHIKELEVEINQEVMIIIVINVEVEEVEGLDTETTNHKGIVMHLYKSNQIGTFWRRLNSHV